MATIIDGKTVSADLKARVAKDVERLNQNGIQAALAVVIVGDDPASRVYVNNKKKACALCGIKSEEYALSASTTEKELLELVYKLNNRNDINGILVQLPLPSHINESSIIAAIDERKDVDAFSPANVGKIMQGEYSFLPCTPAGIMEMLDFYNIDPSGRDCVVIGRSNIVGKPMAMLMLHKNATVTICHSRTKDLADKCRNADIIIAAVGKPKFVSADMVKDGAVVIDVGINRMPDGKLCGDVDFDAVKDKASFITPVPGGVGPMTIATLMKNTVTATALQNGFTL